MSTPLNPSLIKLGRTYHFSEETSEKAEEWGLMLWRLIASQVTFSLPATVREPEISALVAERLTNYLLARLTVRGAYIEKTIDQLPPEMAEADKNSVRDRKYGEAVDEMLDVPSRTRSEIVWYLAKVSPRIHKKGAKLSGAQHAAIERVATRDQHRCYICGQGLSYPRLPHPKKVGETDWRAFEAEHVFSQARGGGRGRDNIAACCQSCNSYKNELLSYADAPVELLSFADLPVETATTSSTTPDTLRKRFGGLIRFALLWRQAGACEICDIKFHDCPDEALFLSRRNPQDSYHFFNAMIVCRSCIEGQRAEGVVIRE